jgi:hypothetical protein
MTYKTYKWLKATAIVVLSAGILWALWRFGIGAAA